jgi:hypothetical protein
MASKILGDCKNVLCTIQTERIVKDVETCNTECVGFMATRGGFVTVDGMECPYCGCYVDDYDKNEKYLFDDPVFPIKTKCCTCDKVIFIDEPPEMVVELFKDR